MKTILKSVGLLVLLGTLAMADLPTGTFGFDMKTTLKANGKKPLIVKMVAAMMTVIQKSKILLTLEKG